MSGDPLPDFPMPRAAGCPFDPPPDLAQLRRERPVTRVRLWDGSQAWLLTRHADVRAAFSEARLSADVTRAGYPHVSAGSRAGRTMAQNFMVTDDPVHQRIRNALAPEFSLREAEKRREPVRRIVEELLDRMERLPRPLDLLEHFAQALPSRVICDVLGVPLEDNAFCLEQLRVVLHSSSSPEEGRRANQALLDYIDGLVGIKDRALGDGPPRDMISRLVLEQLRPGHMTRGEILANVRQIIVAGQDSTANTLALGILFLLRNPAMLEEILAAPQARWPHAVEEIVRLMSVTHQGRRRVAAEDVVIGGQLIRAGEGVIVAENSANRDDSVFAHPDDMDLQRANGRLHVGFGFGIHHCLGASLARVELQEALAALFARQPRLRLAVPFDGIRFRHDMNVYGVYALPVTW